MKITRYLIGSSAVALSLLVASPVLAHSSIATNGSVNTDTGLHLGLVKHVSNDHDSEKDEKSEERKDGEVKIAGTVSAVTGSTITLLGKNGTTYTVNAANAKISDRNDVGVIGNVMVGDTLVVKGALSGSVITAEKIRDVSFVKRSALSAIGAAGAGVITSINGSVFTLSSFGKQGTTTVTTNASTTWKVNGAATSSTALSVGSRAIVFGTANGTGVNASLVSILNVGLGFFKHLFR